MKKLLFLLTVLFTVGLSAQSLGGGSATGLYSVSIGNGSTATQESTTAIGRASQATGLRSTATGDLARANGDYSTANGRAAAARGTSSTAIGASSEANGTNSTALGAGAFSSGIGSTAIGQGSQATTNGAIALGNGAVANSGNAVQIGAGTNSRTGTVQIGGTGTGQQMSLNVTKDATVNNNLYVNGYMFTNQIVASSGAVQFNGATVSGVRAGVAGNDAVNVNQLNATKAQTTQDIATAKSEAIAASNTYTDTKVADVKSSLDSKIDSETKRALAAEQSLRLDLGNETNRAISAEKAITNEMKGLGAISAAMSAAQGSQLYNPTKKGNISIGTGYYSGATAVSAGASYFTSPNTKINANVATGTYTKLAVGVGASFGF